MQPENILEGADSHERIGKVKIVTDIKEMRKLFSKEKAAVFAELLLEKTMHTVRDLSAETRKRIITIHGDIPDTDVSEESPIRTTEEWQTIKQRIIKNYLSLQQKEELLLATEGEKVVGVVGVMHTGEFKDREVYEICHVVVLPTERGRGISTMLIDAAIEKIHTKNPQAYIDVYTQQPQLISDMQRRGAHELRPADTITIEGLEGIEAKQTLQRRNAKEREGWKIFLLNPQK